MFTKADIEKYFIAEKQESVVFFLTGVIAITAAVFFVFYYKTHFAKGMALPLVAIALIQLAVGITVYRRSDRQRTDMVYCYDLDQARMREEEVPRMQTVIKNFATIRWVEIALAIAGLLLIFFYRQNALQQLWYGVGVGLAVQSILMLIADFFAEKRGHEYLNGLKHFLHL